MDQVKSVAIELLEQRVAELERVRNSLQQYNTQLVLKNRELEAKLATWNRVAADYCDELVKRIDLGFAGA